MKSKYSRVGLGLLLVACAVLALPNARSLDEGIIYYLRYAVISSGVIQSIRPDGRYASLYSLVRLRNVERLAYLMAHLDLPNVSVLKIPIPGYPLPSLFVRFDGAGPYTIYSAHYDKLLDDPVYQGASDNTAALSVLLASITELAKRGDGGSRAFLFTGEEETGLHGASAFVEYARSNNIAIREIVNFDNLGRGNLAIRPSAPVPGYVISLPFCGDMAYDGRAFRPSPPYPRANVRLTQALLRLRPDIVVFERFTAFSDSNVFQANGIDTVALSGDDMRYLDLTWHTYRDRVELLDERNLDLAFELILGYGASQ